MNIIDIVVILFILLCVISGLRRGVIKETVDVVGTILTLILSFSLMGSVAGIFYKFMPFLSLGLLGISLSTLNILVYQIIAFAIVYLIINGIFRLVVSLTKVVDKLVSSLLIFNTASSILGGIVGLISGYLFCFVILTIISVPLADNAYFHEAKSTNIILKNTPVLTNLSKNLNNTTTDIYTLTTKISKDPNKVANSNQYNLEMLDIMLKYNIVSTNTIESLREQNKLSDMKNIDKVLNKYR